MKTTLLIARHGNTFAPDEIVRRVGITDLPLTDSGVLQGARLGTYLAQQQLIPDVIFTSQLTRTIQTATAAQQMMQTQLALEKLVIFNEIDYGPDENQPEDQVVARIGKTALAAWETTATVPPGWKVDPQEIIHHWQTFAERIRQDYAGKTILVVTSNGIARFAPYLTGDFSRFSAQHAIKLSTGALGILVDTPPVWQCVRWNVRP